MRLWPKSKKVKELERRLQLSEASCKALEGSVQRLVEQLDKTEQYRSNWKEKHAKLSKAHVKLQKAHGLRGRKIKELKGIINQLKERGNGRD